MLRSRKRGEMGYKLIAIWLFLGVCASLPAAGQQVTAEGPVQEWELVTLTRDMTVDQALQMIRAYAKREIVYPQGLTGPIGVDIDREHWRRALGKIAAKNDLHIVDRGNFFELLAAAENEKQGIDFSEVSVDSREVSITAIFFQADRLALRELGIDWSTLRGGRVDVSASHLGANKVASEQFSVQARANINRSLSVDILLKTFESENTGEVMARPQIKVRSGKQGL